MTEETEKITELKEKLKTKKELLEQKNAVLADKQAIVNEINKEKAEIKNLKDQNKAVKKEIFETSNLGKTVKVAEKAGKITGKGIAIAGKAAGRFLSSESTKKVIRNSTLGLGNMLGLLTKKQVKGIKKRFK